MNKWKNTGKKVISSLLQTILVLTGITIVTFLILYLAPGNPAEIWLTGGDANVGQISEGGDQESRRKRWGLISRFSYSTGHGLSGFSGDLGKSMTTSAPVAEELAKHIVPTLSLTLASLVLTVLISVPLGVYCAVYRGPAAGQYCPNILISGNIHALLFISLVLLWIFCLKLQVFPVIASNDWKGMVLPAAVLVIQCSLKLTRQVRGGCPGTAESGLCKRGRLPAVWTKGRFYFPMC